jgi:hypothetical protein
MRTRAQERVEQRIESQPQGPLPPPVTDTNTPLPSLMAPSNSRDSPLAIDSDTEVDFANSNSRSHSKRQSRKGINGHNSHLSRASGISGQDLRRAFGDRRPWITSPATEGESGDDIPQVDYGRATPDPPPEREPVEQPEPPAAQSPMVQNPSLPSSPSTLLKRLRTASFSPFSTIRRGSRIFGGREGPAAPEQNGAVPSSESSSDDDDLSIISRHTVHRNNRDSYSDEEDEYDAVASQDH